MKRSTWTIARLLLAGLFLAQCAAGNVFATLPARHTSIIFVADGQGGQGEIVDGLNQNIVVSRMPLRVQQFNWTTLSLQADFQNQYNFVLKSSQLAEWVMVTRQKCPDAKIYLVGYGAGTTVILKAAECLPENSVTRIILIAPTVSCAYDLRRALRSSCEGIDSFYSRGDAKLEIAIKCLGPTDIGKKSVTSAAGLYGFVPQVHCTPDAQLYTKLWQHNMKSYSAHQYQGHTFVQTEIIPLFHSALYYSPASQPYAPRPQPKTPPMPPIPPPAQPDYPPPPPAPSTGPQGDSGPVYSPVPTIPNQRPLPPIVSKLPLPG